MSREKKKSEAKEKGFPKIYVYFIGILAALIVVAGIILLMNPQAKPSATLGDGIVVVKAGDVVVFDYVVRFENGTVADTSLKDVAVASGIFVENKSYAPMGVVLQPGMSGLVRGVENALIGMRVGEEKNVTLPPEDAYGDWKSTRTLTVPRESRVSRIQTYDSNNLAELAGIPASEIKAGSEISLSGWPATVLEATNSTATIKNNPVEGQNFSIPSASMFVKVSFGDYVQDEMLTLRPLEGTVLKVTEGEITYRFDAPTTGKYFIRDTASGATVEARIFSLNSTSIVFDYNHPFAGKMLACQLNVVNITSS